jgi:hypothetical protein
MKLIFITLGGLFVIVIILAISLSGGKNTPKNQSTTGTPVNNAQNLGKASAIDVENVNNSISQSLGSLSDDNDFPADQLDDKPLGL